MSAATGVVCQGQRQQQSIIESDFLGLANSRKQVRMHASVEECTYMVESTTEVPDVPIVPPLVPVCTTRN